MTLLALLGNASLPALSGLVAFATRSLWIQAWSENEILFTSFPPQTSGGLGKILVRGGDYAGTLLSLPGCYVNIPGKHGYDPAQPDDEILPIPKDKILACAGDPSKLKDLYARYDPRAKGMRDAGAYYVGFLRKVRKYRWDWLEKNQNKTVECKDEYRHRNEMTEVFMANDFTYYFHSEKVNTKDGPLMEMFYSVTVRVTNPRKAYSNVDNWLVQIEALANMVVRDFIGSHNVEDLRTETPRGEGDPRKKLSDSSKEHFTECLMAFNTQSIGLDKEEDNGLDHAGNGTKGRWGITIVTANVVDISLVGDLAQDNEKAVSRKFVAETVKAATITEAEGASRARALEGEGEEAYLTAQAAGLEATLATYDKHPEMSKTLLVTGAIKASDKTIVLGMNGLVNDVLSGVGKALEKAND